MNFSFTNTIKNKLLNFYTWRIMRSRKKKTLSSNKNLLEPQVCLLYTLDVNDSQKTQAVAGAVKKLERSGKTVAVLCYLPDKIIQPMNGFTFFYAKDVNFLGTFRDPKVKKILHTTFDYFYHLDLVSEPILDYIVASSSSKCKIGNFAPNRSHIFEILFKDLVEGNDKPKFDNLINKMLDYTQLLQV